jgi:hypothetical protein
VDVTASGSSFDAGIPKELFNVPVPTINRRNNYVATADGQRFLFITTQTGEDTQPFGCSHTEAAISTQYQPKAAEPQNAK